MDNNYNSKYRIGFYNLTVEEKNKIKNALDNRFFEFNDDIILNDHLLDKPDLIISGLDYISNELQSIINYSLSSLIMVSSKSEDELKDSQIFSLCNKEFDDLINGIVKTAMYQNALKVRMELEMQFKEEDSVTDKLEKLLAFVKKKDEYSFEHSVNVSEYAAMIATELGYDKSDINKIKIGGLVHDIGKICLPNSILFNTTPTLDQNQMKVMQNHPSFGIVILPDELEEVFEMVLLHHERLDGSGYPLGLDASRLSDMVRIISVADTYDAMTTERTYQAAMDIDTAFGVLYKLSSDSSLKLDRNMVIALEKAISKTNEKNISKTN